VTVTVAPVTTAPDESVTWPVMLPVSLWAASGIDDATNNASVQIQ
jgi:hypothetical protein